MGSVEGRPLNHLDRVKAELERQHPGFRIWYVPLAVGGVSWCAGRVGAARGEFVADSPEHLSDYIAASAGGEQGGQ